MGAGGKNNGEEEYAERGEKAPVSSSLIGVVDVWSDFLSQLSLSDTPAGSQFLKQWQNNRLLQCQTQSLARPAAEVKRGSCEQEFDRCSRCL
eukprot:9476563-Pyramimonas_sp.AAC.1